MGNLDNTLSTKQRNGLIWWLLVVYSIAITSLFTYLIIQLRGENEFLKEELAKCQASILQARLDERQNILQILKDANK
jgi:hypothetical protein